MAKRFVIEGEWSGYRSSQQRIVHREARTLNKKQQARWAEIRGLRYTDGTHLYVSVREAKPRERIEPMLGYRSLPCLSG